MCTQLTYISRGTRNQVVVLQAVKDVNHLSLFESVGLVVQQKLN